MKRPGSILIVALLVFVVVMMGVLYVLHSSSLHMHIVKNNSISNQAFYFAEKKIYMSLFEDKYYKNQLLPMLEAYCRGVANAPSIFTVNINKEDLDFGDSNNLVKASLEIKNNRKCINIIGQSKVNNQTIKVSSVYSIFHDLYELGQPVIHPDYLDFEQQEELINLISTIEKDINLNKLLSNIYGISTFDFESIVVNTIKNNDLELNYYRNDTLIKTEQYITKHLKYVNDFLIIMKDKFDNNVNFHIDSPSNKTTMGGILYIEGDLIIDSEFIFNGIIIINNGRIIVNSEIKPQINGIIISNGEEGWINLDELIVNYDSSYIYRYGTYLPNFLDYKFIVMKKAK